MTSLSTLSKLRLGITYILPTIAAILFTRWMLEAKYQEGWFDAQGCQRAAGCVLGTFDPFFFGFFGAVVIASFVLVGNARPRWGNGLALAVMLLAVLGYIGLTY